MPSQKPDVEILVHITAPSKSSDDKIYRQLAQSYVKFRPKRRKRVQVAQLPNEDDAAIVNPGNERVANEDDEVGSGDVSQQRNHVTAQPPASSSQEYSTAFQDPHDHLLAIPFDSQDLSFRSAVDNLGSPVFDNMITMELEIQDSQAHSHTHEDPETFQSQSSWVAPASEVGDSYPIANTSLLSASPTDLLERYLGRPAVRRAIGGEPSPEKVLNKTPRKRGSIVVEVPSSQPEHPSRTSTSAPLELAFIPLSVDDEIIPDTAPRSVHDGDLAYKSSSSMNSNNPGLGQSQRPHADTSDGVDEFYDITHISNSSLCGNSDLDVAKALPVPKSPEREQLREDVEQEYRTSPHTEANRAEELEVQKSPRPSKKRKHARSDSDSSTVTSKLCRSLSVEISLDSSLATTESFEAISSSPPVSIDDVHPDDLIPPKLAKLADDLSSRYRAHSLEPIQPLDRGYWLLDCSSFSEERREKTWTFLARYIRSGLAGWGVWCRRAEDGHSVKVFCWGYVVKHVYLLVYLASERALKGVGAMWIGHDGLVKIEVTPTSGQGNASTT